MICKSDAFMNCNQSFTNYLNPSQLIMLYVQFKNGNISFACRSPEMLVKKILENLLENSI